MVAALLTFPCLVKWKSFQLLPQNGKMRLFYFLLMNVKRKRKRMMDHEQTSILLNPKYCYWYFSANINTISATAVYPNKYNLNFSLLRNSSTQMDTRAEGYYQCFGRPLTFSSLPGRWYFIYCISNIAVKMTTNNYLIGHPTPSITWKKAIGNG